MKKIQFKICKVWSTYIDDDDVNLTEESELHNAIAETIERENTTEKIMFYENLELVCSECGVSLNLDEEKEEGICVQCANNKEVEE